MNWPLCQTVTVERRHSPSLHQRTGSSQRERSWSAVWIHSFLLTALGAERCRSERTSLEGGRREEVRRRAQCRQRVHRRRLMCCCYSRMPSPLLALMERPGSARFLVMEGMLTEPLKPARLSWTRTFWFKHANRTNTRTQHRVQCRGQQWGGCRFRHHMLKHLTCDWSERFGQTDMQARSLNTWSRRSELWRIKEYEGEDTLCEWAVWVWGVTSRFSFQRPCKQVRAANRLRD